MNDDSGKKKKKKGGGALLFLALLGGGAFLFSRRAKANPTDPVGPIFPVTPTDPDPVGPIFPVTPVEPPPVIPQGQASNYVGSGWSWPDKNTYPTETSIVNAFFLLGYPMSFAPRTDGPNPSGANMISSHNMTLVREFQRDYNAAVNAQTVDANPSPSHLDDDGLAGKNTLTAVKNARRWQQVLNLSWADIVALA